LLCEQQELPALISELSQSNQRLADLLQSQQEADCRWLSYFITLRENAVEALE